MATQTKESFFALRLKTVRQMFADRAPDRDIQRALENLTRSAGRHQENRALAYWLQGAHLAASGRWKPAAERFAKAAGLSKHKYLAAECLLALSRLEYLQRQDLAMALSHARQAGELVAGYMGISLQDEARQLAEDISRELENPCQDDARHFGHVISEVVFRPLDGRVIGEAE